METYANEKVKLLTEIRDKLKKFTPNKSTRKKGSKSK